MLQDSISVNKEMNCECLEKQWARTAVRRNGIAATQSLYYSTLIEGIQLHPKFESGPDGTYVLIAIVIISRWELQLSTCKSHTPLRLMDSCENICL